MGAIGQGSIQLMLRSKLGDAVSTMRPVNMSAHGGIRGILALHVALFHFLLFSDLKLHTCGNVHMPFFFLLSGFSLSATYPNLDINTSWLALKGFYQNRLARCLPVFYLCNAVGIILTYFGHGPHKTEFVSALVNSIFAICTWKNGEGPSFNGPGWTVSTLMAFYWLFPVFNALARHAVTAPRINPYLQLVFGGLISASLFYGAFFLTMALCLQCRFLHVTSCCYARWRCCYARWINALNRGRWMAGPYVVASARTGGCTFSGSLLGGRRILDMH